MIGAVFTILWGVVIDRCDFRAVYVGSISCFSVIAIGFVFVSGSKIMVSICYTLLQVFNSGIVICVGPALIKYYGLKLGEELFPVI